MRSALAIGLLLVLPGVPAAERRFSAVDLDLLEAVFHFLFREVGWPGARYYCIATGTPDEQEDPPQALLRRLALHRPPVVPASECEVSSDGDRHRTSGHPAQSFLVGSVHWTGQRRAEVKARFHVHERYAGAFACTADRAGGAWRTDCFLFEMPPGREERPGP